MHCCLLPFACCLLLCFTHVVEVLCEQAHTKHAERLWFECAATSLDHKLVILIFAKFYARVLSAPSASAHSRSFVLASSFETPQNQQQRKVSHLQHEFVLLFARLCAPMPMVFRQQQKKTGNSSDKAARIILTVTTSGQDVDSGSSRALHKTSAECLCYYALLDYSLVLLTVRLFLSFFVAGCDVGYDGLL